MPAIIHNLRVSGGSYGSLHVLSLGDAQSLCARSLPTAKPVVLCPNCRTQLHNLVGRWRGVPNRCAGFLPRHQCCSWKAGSHHGCFHFRQCAAAAELLFNTHVADCINSCSAPCTSQPIIHAAESEGAYSNLSSVQITTVNTFYASAGAGLAGALLTWIFLPDTTDLDLAEIDRLHRYMLADKVCRLPAPDCCAGSSTQCCQQQAMRRGNAPSPPSFLSSTVG
jgi:hypothetical protein